MQPHDITIESVQRALYVSVGMWMWHRTWSLVYCSAVFSTWQWLRLHQVAMLVLLVRVAEDCVAPERGFAEYNSHTCDERVGAFDGMRLLCAWSIFPGHHCRLGGGH